ncbi:MAG: branched-chain amino acid ABC transporter permease [Armatimonadetes bacterium]|nr:branched-chain amino acid ABC transporter permease [Armatimonadota bacterium]
MPAFFKRHLTALVIIAVALVVGAGIPQLFPSPYYLNLFVIVIVNAVLAMAFVLMLRAGLINLGLASFWGLGGYVSAVLVMKLNLSFWLSLPLTALISAALAFILGYILIGSGSTGFTFVILSSVIGMLFTAVVGSIDSVGGHGGLSKIPRPDPIDLPGLPALTFDSRAHLFYLAVFLFVVIIFVLRAFYSAWTGRAWTAIALNPKLAESVGVNVFRYRMLSFVLGSAIVGLIGSFYAHYESFLSPNTFGIWQNIKLQIFAILGGLGYPIAGPLLGAGVMALLAESMRSVQTVSPAVQGAILILLILFLPTGLLGLLQWRTSAKDRTIQAYTAVSSGLGRMFRQNRS